MPEPFEWQASLLEQRIAWAVACVCIVLMIAASTRPDWFDLALSSSEQQTSVPESAKAENAQAAGQTARSETRPVKTWADTTVAPTETRAEKTEPAKTTVKPAAPAAKAAVTTPKAAKIAAGYYVQLGAFKEQASAQGLRDQFRKKGWSSLVVDKKGGLHAVWIGPKPSRAAAEELLKAIQRKLNRKGFIVFQQRT